MFQIKHLKYKDILDINELELDSARIYCLFGESGSGKSTLLKMFNGMLTPDDGEVLFKKEKITALDPVELRKEVVMLGQDPVVFEGTVRDNFLAGLRFSGKEEAADQELKTLLKELHLNKDLNDDAGNLSGGEQQRLAFGRVLLMNATVYLMDEPTSALDEDTEKAVMDYFTEMIKRKGKTVIMVTHSKEIAERYSDRIIYMDEILSKAGGYHE
ncbi:ABC transporter ATP-binding protein [Gracilibacillus massiliensis]|uniref:ABC transporter ATP-binding protein n=1 Tax=Gracilibacillus massiliensis TaxID=1564956 RepID=UPI00071CC719|nr:ABC transporter ATP-binding protein [Gracilibacillus massiliensis]